HVVQEDSRLMNYFKRVQRMKSMNHSKHPMLLISLIFLSCASMILDCDAHEIVADTLSGKELKQKNLEELMQMDITSVSKHKEKLFETPAAVQVVTADDIVRSGA